MANLTFWKPGRWTWTHGQAVPLLENGVLTGYSFAPKMRFRGCCKRCGFQAVTYVFIAPDESRRPCSNPCGHALMKELGLTPFDPEHQLGALDLSEPSTSLDLIYGALAPKERKSA